LNRKKQEKQDVYVLKDGFFGWQVHYPFFVPADGQARYGADKTLTEDWDKEVWEYYL
jgi:hypothetical protein